MIILSKLADYGVIVATHLAAVGPAQVNASQVALETRLPPATVAKVLKLLGRAGLVVSGRGAAGGYRLARPAHMISVAEIVAAIDGSMGLTQCTSQSHVGPCSRGQYCPTRPHWQRISIAFERALAEVTLSEMVTPPPPVFPSLSIPASLGIAAP